MNPRTAYGAAIIVAFRAAAANLELHVKEVDALNVFPVPDGDTGTNMLATVRSALQEAEAVPPAERTLPRVAAAISFGALMGARGNSGVILSQILRGMVEVARERRIVNGLDLAYALQRGSETAYSAIARPVEGTILTVVRETAAAAGEAAERDPRLLPVLAAAVSAAERSVAGTPALLPVLREAGVVDSGGQGLFRLLEGTLRAMTGDPAPRPEAPGVAGPHLDPAGETADDWGYETMFLVAANGSALDLEAMRRALEAMGDSVLVAGDERLAKVHVHNDRPDQVIAYGLTLGALSRITVENLDQQTMAVEESRTRALTGTAPAADHQPAGGATNGIAPEESIAPALVAASPVGLMGEHAAGDEDASPDGTAVVVVAAGEGLARAMESTGARGAVLDGRAGAPSAGDLLSAMRRTGAREIVLLPNDRNVRLAARLAARLAPDLSVKVVPTRSGPEGVAAMLAFDPERTAAENARPMFAAARGVRTLSVTTAVRDARFADRRVRKGQTIVLDPDEGLMAVHGDPLRAVVDGVAALEPGFELLTVYYGDGADLAEAEQLAARLTDEIEGVEVEILHGGQAHYRYLIAAE